jgi:hypothetical protein
MGKASVEEGAVPLKAIVINISNIAEVDAR